MESTGSLRSYCALSSASPGVPASFARRVQYLHARVAVFRRHHGQKTCGSAECAVPRTVCHHWRAGTGTDRAIHNVRAVHSSNPPSSLMSHTQYSFLVTTGTYLQAEAAW